MPLETDAEIKTLLENARHIAVVGYSTDPARPSHGVAQQLRRFGYQMSPVNPTVKGVPDETIYPTLADVPGPIDIVDIFRRAEAVPEVVEEAIRVGAKAIWMQIGIVNEEAAQRAEAAGLQVVMDRCIKIDYWRLMGDR